MCSRTEIVKQSWELHILMPPGPLHPYLIDDVLKSAGDRVVSTVEGGSLQTTVVWGY